MRKIILPNPTKYFRLERRRFNESSFTKSGRISTPSYQRKRTDSVSFFRSSFRGRPILSFTQMPRIFGRGGRCKMSSARACSAGPFPRDRCRGERDTCPVLRALSSANEIGADFIFRSRHLSPFFCPGFISLFRGRKDVVRGFNAALINFGKQRGGAEKV